MLNLRLNVSSCAVHWGLQRPERCKVILNCLFFVANFAAMDDYVQLPSMLLSEVVNVRPATS